MKKLILHTNYSFATFFTIILFYLAFNLMSRFMGIDWNYWHTILIDGVQVWKIGGVYGDNWNSIQFNPFPLKKPSLWIFFSLIVLFITVIFGKYISKFLLLETFISDSQNSLRFIIYFLPGYLAIAAIMRFFTLLDNAHSGVKFIFAVFSVFLMQEFRLRIKRSKDVSPQSIKPVTFDTKRRNALKVAGSLCIVFFFLVWSLQNGRNFMVNDSNIIFVNDIYSNLSSRTLEKIPLIGKQSDEYFFNLFPISLGNTKESILLAFWTTNAVGKTSLLYWLFALVSKLTQIVIGRDGKISSFRLLLFRLSCCSWVFFGSTSLVPHEYVELWGGSNPILRSGHLGRYFIFLIPVWIYYSFYESNILRRFFSFLLGFSLLSGTTITNLLFSLIIIFLLTSLTVVKNLKFSKTSMKGYEQFKDWIVIISCQFIPILLVKNYGNSHALVTLMYLLPALWLFSILLISKLTDSGLTTFLEIRKLYNGWTSVLHLHLSIAISSVFGMVLGAVLWGNSHGIKMLDFTFNFLLKHGIELRIYSGKMFDDFSNNANLGHWTTCPPVTPACSTLNGFVNFFGLTIFIYLALGYFVARGIRKYSSVTRSLSLIASLLWASTHAFLWSYGSPLMIDYWILSRLLEIPVYFVVIVFVLFLIELDEHNQFIVNVFLLLIWLWVLVPITSLSIIPQFTHNFRFFFAQF